MIVKKKIKIKGPLLSSPFQYTRKKKSKKQLFIGKNIDEITKV